MAHHDDVLKAMGYSPIGDVKPEPIILYKQCPIPPELEAAVKYGRERVRRVSVYEANGMMKPGAPSADVFHIAPNRASKRKSRKPFGRKRLRHTKQMKRIDQIREHNSFKRAVLEADSNV